MSLSIHLLQILDAILNFHLLFVVDRRQEVLNDVVLPVVNLAVPNLFLSIVITVLDVESCVVLVVAEADLVELFCKKLFAAVCLTFA